MCALSLLWGVILAGEGDVSRNDTPATARFDAALQQASEIPESPYLLQVNCTDHKGIRSFELFPGGATIWNRRSQVMLPVSARSVMLKTLLDREFSSFEDSYGGRERPEKSAAPAKITCRVRIDIQGIEKSSVQMAGGEQSKKLLALAASLLDQAEQYSDGAVTPVDLKDALDKLYNGQLAPQILRLRFMELPSVDKQPGVILRLSGNQMSRQTYSPGHPGPKTTVEPLGHDQYIRLIEVMRKEQFTGFPANLWSEDQLEIELEVLAHKKVVLARRFARLESARQTPAQQRFDNIVLILRDLAH